MHLKCDHLVIWLEFSIPPILTVLCSRDRGFKDDEIEFPWGCHEERVEDEGITDPEPHR